MSDAQIPDQTRRLVNLIAEALDEGPDARTHVTEVAAHVLAVLSETHAVVELPEPLGDDGVNQAWTNTSMWHATNRITLHNRTVRHNGTMTPDDAESLAIDILAAVRAARAAEATR